jgi:hypothetical protein
MQKARRHPCHAWGSDCLQAHGFRIYFTPLTGVLFTFPSRYLFTIGRQGVFSLARWSSQIPPGFHVSRGTRVPTHAPSSFAYRALTVSGLPSQTARLDSNYTLLSAPQPRQELLPAGLGSSRFAHHYSGNRVFFLLLQVLRCFSSPRSPCMPMYSACSDQRLRQPGFPIRTSPDHRLFAATRSFSQRTTSFIAS